MSVPRIQDIYALSPLQEGMLFHSLLTPAVGMYIEQVSWELRGPLDRALFARAWTEVVARHPILRTSFSWEQLDHPVQVVHAHVDMPVEGLDWRGLPEVEQEARLAALLAADRQRDFDPGAPPLMRLALARTDDTTHHLVWTHHHLILDGWSAMIVLNEALAIYDDLVAGRATPLPPPRPYRDYIAWIQRQDIRAAERYWRDALRGVTSPTPLPWSPVAEADGRLHGAQGRRALALPADTADSLAAFSRRHQITLNTVLEGAWAILLAAHARERDVVFGVTVSGRPSDLPGVESMVGLFINTLPTRTRVHPDAALIPWLQWLQSTRAEVRQYEYSPLVEVRGWSAMPRQRPLFESLFAFENYPSSRRPGGRDGDTPALALRPVSSASSTHYPLALLVTPGPPLGVRMLYDTARFDQDTVDRLLDQLGCLLGGFAEDPNRPLSALPLLSPRERHRILVEWNATQSPYPRDATLDALVDRAVAEHSERVAIQHGVSTWTYRQLGDRVDRLARRIGALGVPPGSRVAICVDRSAAAVVAILAVLKRGCTYVPLDPEHPPMRLAWMLRDTRSRAVLTRAPQRSLFDGADVPVLDLDAPAGAAGDFSGPPPVGNADATAYVMYTSGSTGQPKGVCVPHRAVIRLVIGADYARFGPNTRVAQASNLSFDAATFEIWGALLHGGTLVFIARDELLDPPRLAAALRRERIDMMFLTTALFNRVVREVPTAFATLRDLLVGGEALSPTHVRTALEHGPPERLLNMYGPTENTTFSTYHPVSLPVPAPRIPIGKPIANTTGCILDRERRPVPVGVVGELYLGGDGLASAYLDRAELTADRFIAKPFPDAPGERFYRTGDLCRWLPEGGIDCVGRDDDQVKLRGFRVEPGEVEATLRQHPGVSEVAVVAREEPDGECALVAYVTLTAPEEPPPDLRTYLAQRLPPYLVPAFVVPMRALPLTANGKLDRAALPPAIAPAHAPAPRPLSDAERQVAQLFREVLCVEDVGPDASFFDLGGHSLRAMQLVSRVRDTFDVEVPLRAIFQAPTLAGVAAEIERLLLQEIEALGGQEAAPAAEEAGEG
jgi:amino acid adenylation domain-containing protein